MEIRNGNRPIQVQLKKQKIDFYPEMAIAPSSVQS